MMKYQAPLPPKYRLVRVLRPVIAELRKLHGSDVAWQHRRFLGTAAVRDTPNTDGSKKKISKEERKVMVESYVNKYRVMNAGKFPTAKVTMKQVGGSYYTIRGILQELEYNSKLPTMVTPEKHSMVGQIAEVKGVSEAREALDSQVSVGRTILGGNYVISAKDDTSSQGDVGNNSCQMIVDKSVLSENKGISAEDVSESKGVVDLELERVCERTSSAEVDESRGVFETPSLVEKISVEKISVEKVSVDKSVKATTIDDSEFPAKPGHPSEVPSTQRNTELGDIDQIPSQDKFSRETATQPSQKDNELKRSSSLWGNLKSFASNIISIWRKT